MASAASRLVVGSANPRENVDYRLDDFVLDPAGTGVRFKKDKERDDIAEAVIDEGTNNVTLTIEGASTVELTILDTDLAFLNGDLITAWTWGKNADDRNHAHWMAKGRKIDAQLDDLWFRLVRVEKQSADTVQLTCEDRAPAKLRQHRGALKVYRDSGVTRAEFVAKLCREARVDYFIPELHEKQPIAQPDTPAPTRVSRRFQGPGPAAVRKLEVEGKRAKPEQLRNAQTILDEGVKLGAREKVLIAAIVCSINESRLINVHHGDAPGPDSRGLFQQRASWGPESVRQDPAGASRLFFKAAIKKDRQFPGATIPELITLVQFPGVTSPAATHTFAGGQVPQWEQRWVEEGTAIVEAYVGRIGLPDSSQTIEVKKRYPFARGKNETSWDCIQRLAEEVQWRAFVRRGVLWYVSEEWLFDQPPTLHVEEGEGGVDLITFAVDLGARNLVAEMTVIAHAAQWTARPGMKVHVHGQGAAADGPWLVHRAERAPWDDLVTITLNKPLPKKLEPANETDPVTFGGTLPDSVSAPTLKALTPKQIIDQYVLPIARKDGINVTPESVAAANANHGSTVTGGRSDHQGPPAQAWAADMSNGNSPTKEMDKLARDLGELFGINVHFGAGNYSGGVWERTIGGFKVQIIYRTLTGGNHTNHVHCGLHRV